MPAIEMISAINAEIMKLREGGSDIKYVLMNPGLNTSLNGTPKIFAIVVNAAITADADQSALIALACSTAPRPSLEIV
jgi:hypothetical protein